jgi:serine/threonine-protein kinase
MPDLLERLRSALADRYTIEREIGSGGMAVVYLAGDRKHQRRVGLKVLRPELAATLGGERFLQEIRVTANLQHPHILPLYDSGEADGLLYYVMPYVEGESLRDRLSREKQLPVEDALRITEQVASALEFAHRRDVIHRDIKPENILLHEGVALVADFGIALAVTAAGGERLTDTGLSIGTPEYMSPEQAAADRELDARSDVYAVGCVLFEMLAGEPPYTGRSPRTVLAKALTDPVPSVRRLRPAVPESVEVALNRALAKAPADRYGAAAAFAAALTAPCADRQGTPSVAVLPLANLSADPENAFFADGITEDVIAQLSKIPSLKVISRTSVMRFKHHSESLEEIAATLGVATVLEGSVRRAGNRVRIVAQLIDAATDDHLWTETYDRDLSDIFAIQSDVALRIAEALEAELTDELKSRIAKEPTQDLVAYQLYLQGRQFFARLTGEGLEQAIEHFRQATERDPGFAHAYANEAFAWVAIGMGSGGGSWKPDVAYAEAKAAAAKAIRIDDTLGEAYAALAFPMFVHDFDWPKAEQAMQRALELNPNAADTLNTYGQLLAAQGRHEEAIAVQRRAQELDPLTTWHATALAASLLRAGRYGDALQEAKRVQRLEPHFPLGHAQAGWACLQQGLYDEGLAELERAVSLSPADTQLMGQLGQAYAMAGRLEDARAMLRRMEQRSRDQYVPPYHFAYVYTGVGEVGKALDALEQSYEERAGSVYGIKGSFLFAPLREHPRFIALLRKMHLEEETARG